MKMNKFIFWSLGIVIVAVCFLLIVAFNANFFKSGNSFNNGDKQIEILKKYWKYQLDGNCVEADKLTTSFSGYERDSEGRVILPRMKVQVTVKGQESETGSDRKFCRTTSAMIPTDTKIRKIVSVKEEPELLKTTIRIYVADDTIFKVEFIVLLTKENETSDWKIYSISPDNIIE